MTDTRAPTTCTRLGVVLLGLLLVTASAVTVSAAGSTTVSLHAAGSTVEEGETTTIDVVVDNADGGVGTYNATVAVDDPDVASITDVELAGDPGLDEVEIADDGSKVSIRAALMNTTDAGAVTIATITLAGDADGSSDVSLSVATLGDEEGRAYSVSETRGSSVAVSEDDDDDDEDDSSSDSADASSTDGPTATPDGTSTTDSSVDPTGTSSPVTTTPSADSPPTSSDENSGSSLLPTSLLNVALVAGAVLVTGLLLARRFR
ncbi:hypothetical protein HUG10_06780 [Halorarum halophilum]|uniref:Cohesin domain-containing protein n=1 Tax=Halorarum halophilum TaxID=2743090 RepID=A0A7D5GKG0_9EURY|nr:hypothetical protein [Halobaculum halophilum]QLG27267.1 hypothetical protein HUG10_06780 [Halobaculum halophilum]